MAINNRFQCIISAFFIFIVSLILAACSSNDTGVVKTTVPTFASVVAQDWQTEWLRGQPCQLPCWEGITPGVTSIEQANKILQNNKLFTNVTYSITGNSGGVNWGWSNLVQSSGGDAYVNAQDVQSYNSIQVIRPAYSEKFIFKEIIQQLGEPNLIWVAGGPPKLSNLNSPSRYILSVAYVDLGLALEMSTKGEKPDISSNLSFDRVYFYKPNKRDFGSIYQSIVVSTAWQGFRNFDFYCSLAGTSNCT